MRSIINLAIIFGLVGVMYQNSPSFQGFADQAVQRVGSQIVQAVATNIQEDLNSLGGVQL